MGGKGRAGDQRGIIAELKNKQTDKTMAAVVAKGRW